MEQDLNRATVDMTYVYTEIDNGRTVKSLASELKISRSTLYRYHEDYQMRNLKNPKRKYLTNGRGRTKQINMAEVYKKLREGRSLVSVARELGVSTKTLYRHAEQNEKQK